MYAFVFPGQGSQKVGMGRELHDAFGEAREVFEQADRALGYSITKLCFEGPEGELQLTANAQPAILTHSIAMLRCVEEQLPGLDPGVAAGHSLGEYSALVCSGALAFDDAVRLVHQRGTYMQEAVPVGQGAMAAIIGADPATVEQLCAEAAADDEVLCPANYNSPQQTVIAGHSEAVSRAAALVKKQRKGIAKLLKVSAPFHCPLMKPAATRLTSALDAIAVAQPRIAVIANVDAEPHQQAASIKDLLVRQVTGAVRWTDSVHKMLEMGVTEVVELGGSTLSGLIKRIAPDLRRVSLETPDQLQQLR